MRLDLREHLFVWQWRRGEHEHRRQELPHSAELGECLRRLLRQVVLILLEKKGRATESDVSPSTAVLIPPGSQASQWYLHDRFGRRQDAVHSGHTSSRPRSPFGYGYSST